jgi:hypothetical protein
MHNYSGQLSQFLTILVQQAKTLGLLLKIKVWGLAETHAFFALWIVKY